MGAARRGTRRRRAALPSRRASPRCVSIAIPRRHASRARVPRAEMLKTLRIRNVAIIEDLTVDFGPGLNVLTGETGAGKSIIVDALGLAAGDRGDATRVRTGADR